MSLLHVTVFARLFGQCGSKLCLTRICLRCCRPLKGGMSQAHLGGSAADRSNRGGSGCYLRGGSYGGSVQRYERADNRRREQECAAGGALTTSMSRLTIVVYHSCFQYPIQLSYGVASRRPIYPTATGPILS